MAGLVSNNVRSKEALIGDCMHMLRHLRDPAELRRNPLVAPLFAGAAVHRAPRRALIDSAKHLLTIVRDAVEALRMDTGAGDAEHRARQYRILNDCDINGRSRDDVMKQLGISRRQFYRDRKDACEYVAKYIAAQIQQIARPAIVTVDMFSTNLARARTLRHTGLIEKSAGALRELIVETRSCRKKASAWFSLIDLLADDNRPNEAAHEFAGLRAFAGSFADSSANGNELGRMMAVYEPSLIWALGDEREAVAKDARAAVDLHRLARSADQDVRAFSIAAYLSRGHRGFLVGDFESSNDEIDRAGDLMSNTEGVPDSIPLRFMLLDAERKIFTPGAAARARDTLAVAVQLASDRGYIEMLAMALDELALLSQNFNDLQDATKYVRDAVALAERGVTANVRGTILLHAAELAAESRHALRSIELAEEGRGCFPQRGIGASIAWYHVARGRLLMRAFNDARYAAEQLYRNASIGGNQRLIGSGLRLLAQAYAGLGQQKAAQDHIEAAVSVLERFGHPYALRAAYRTSAKITGRAAHFKRAAEIDTALTRSA